MVRSLTPEDRCSFKLTATDVTEMRRANHNDVPLLVSLMAEFYAEADYPLNHEAAASAFAALIADQRLGHIWVIQEQNLDVGHVVVCLRFAMEYGGVVACLDDLYVRGSSRNRGLAGTALRELRRFCEMSGIRAITVEVGEDNAPAQAVYRRAGFEEAAGRQVLALGLATPTHVL